MQFNLSLENIKYTKIVYKDREENTRFIKAAIRSMNENELFACAKFEDGLDIQTPQEVSVSFICENGLYRTNTILKSFQNEEPYVFLFLQVPQGIEYQQNREYFRVKMNENVIVKFNNSVKTCKLYDISANGVRLVLDENITFSENVELNILFDKNNVTAKARYVRTDNDDNILKASFYFTKISDNDVDFIAKKCIQIQLSNRRSSIKG